MDFTITITRDNLSHNVINAPNQWLGHRICIELISKGNFTTIRVRLYRART